MCVQIILIKIKINSLDPLKAKSTFKNEDKLGLATFREELSLYYVY